MIKNLSNKIYFLLLVFFIAPYGFGFSFIPGLQSFDLPKIIPFVLFIIFLLKSNFKKSDSVPLLFLFFIFLHFLSVFYSPNINISLVNFFSSLFLFYPGFFIVFIFINSENSIKRLLYNINITVILYIIFSITEFVFQFNFFDLIRNNYVNANNSFNNNLGMVRLGLKASMGPFASTLPFAYSFACLFFLKDLYLPEFLKGKIKSILFQLLGFIAIVFTLSRAAVLTVITILILQNIFKQKFIKTLNFIIFSSIMVLFTYQQIKQSPFENYINNYVLNIFSDETNGSDNRINNNKIDLTFALESPVIGHGAGSLYQEKIGLRDSTLTSSDSSFLIYIFGDRGLLSLMVFLIIILITTKRCLFLIKNYKDRFNYKSLLYAFIVLFVCINSSHRQEVLFLFFLLIGLINKIYILNKKSC